MSDLLVKLYDLPDVGTRLEQLKAEEICIHKAMVCDKHLVIEWVGDTFGRLWANECDIAFTRQPVSCYLAIKSKKIVGFACYDSCMKNFFGPVGVSEKYRGRGIGTVLLLKCLHAMAAGGYAYAIIGDAQSSAYYEKVVNALVIPGSSPGIYSDRLKYC